MADPPILHLDHISLTFGGTPLLRDIDLSVSAGERLALVGRNGCGKSTLLKIVAGLVEPNEGKIFRQPGTTIRYLPQMPDLAGFDTVLAYIEAGLDGVEYSYRAAALLKPLALDGQAHPSTLSGGQLRRAALARTLAPSPDILLLDEPTNHLDLAAIEWLESELTGRNCALILISHDRRFLENISRTTLWIDRGIGHKLARGFAHFENWRDGILEKEEREQHNLKRQIVREEHWLRYGVTARRKRNVRRLSQLQNLRQHQRDHQAPLGQTTMLADESDSRSRLVIEAREISKSYDDTPLIDNFSIRIHSGDRLGLIGRNGAGKTTLLSLLIGQLKPDSGHVRLGSHLSPAILDQARILNEQQTVGDYLADGRGDTLSVGGQERHVVAYMKDFLFLPEQKRTPIRELSGGERARLMLARLMAKPANLLVLDEPTNDLDMETLDLLQEVIAAFSGTVLLVSHDRDFLDRCVNSILVAEGAGKWLCYAGGYSDMLAQRQAQGSDSHIGRAIPKKETASKRMTPDKVEAGTYSRKKLSFGQQFRLENLPREIEELERRLADIECELGIPRLYTEDTARFHFLSDEFVRVRSALTQCEEEWLELELLRENFEGMAKGEKS